MTIEAVSPAPDLASLKRHGWIGLFAVLGLFGGLVARSAVTEISGAIIAPGMLVVRDSAKRVQHPEGGIVTQLLVRDEDRVVQGQCWRPRIKPLSPRPSRSRKPSCARPMPRKPG
ncbi:hypothetical protein N8D56_09705 [Devosia sp. A8/3-2]|nr:hypothetical protein N8D56_09705 [Devosia sp. A8/3-2]